MLKLLYFTKYFISLSFFMLIASPTVKPMEREESEEYSKEKERFTEYSLNTDFEKIREMLETYKKTFMRAHNNKLADEGHFAPLWFKLLADSKDLTTTEKSKEFCKNIMVLWISAVVHCCIFYNLTCDENQTRDAYDVFKTVCLNNFESLIKNSFVLGGISYKKILKQAKEWFEARQESVLPSSAWVAQLEAKNIHYGFFSSSKNFTSFTINDDVEEKYECLKKSDGNLEKHQQKIREKVMETVIELFENLGNWQDLFNANSQFFNKAFGKAKEDALIPYSQAVKQVANEMTALQKQIEELTLENKELKEKDQNSGKTISQSYSVFAQSFNFSGKAGDDDNSSDE